MADLLANDGAMLARRSADARTFLHEREKQLRELARFMFLLTFVANNFSRADGVVIRDPVAVQSVRKRRQKQSVPKNVAPANVKEVTKVASRQKCTMCILWFVQAFSHVE